MDPTDDLRFCVRALATERFGEKTAQEMLASLNDDENELFRAYRSLANVRAPKPASREFISAQNRMLKHRIATEGITDAAKLPRVPLDARISLWQGDITTLQIDAVVNAANSQMLGCWIPEHHCIDNAIHTFAGIQLRAECDRMMEQQGHPEPTGTAKVTSAHNLPSKWVIHTVGPVVNGELKADDRDLLSSSYRSCLDAAKGVGAQSIAFCCVSTGVFGFPRKEAAEIAVRTTKDWLDEHDQNMHVVFDVFENKDEELYHELLFG